MFLLLVKNQERRILTGTICKTSLSGELVIVVEAARLSATENALVDTKDDAGLDCIFLNMSIIFGP
jgi:hypothetical protein